MDPIVLVDQKTQEAKAFACGKCGTVFAINTKFADTSVQEELAANHCEERKCEDCGEPTQVQYYLKCSKCRERYYAERRRESMAKAEIIHPNDNSGPVYWENKDAYYEDIGDAWDAVCDDPTWDPEEREAIWLQPCHRFHLVLSADEWIESTMESQEHHEDAWDQLPKEANKALQDFLDGWNEKYGREVESWMPDHTKRILIPDSWWADFDKEYEDE